MRPSEMMRPSQKKHSAFEPAGAGRDTSYIRPLIIERSELQTPGQRWGFRSLTFVMWVAWFYLFIPLLSIAAWAVGMTLVYQALVPNLEITDLWRMLSHYAAGIGVLSGIYILWAVSSFIRFRGIERRKLAPVIPDHLYAHSHNLSNGELNRLRSAGLYTVSAEQLDRMFGD